jgi:hypothetical protein
MTGLDRAKRLVHVAPFIDAEGQEVTPPAPSLRHPDHLGGQPEQRLRHPGRA